MQTVNTHGGFGRWRCAVVKGVGEVRDVLMGENMVNSEHIFRKERNKLYY